MWIAIKRNRSLKEFIAPSTYSKKKRLEQAVLQVVVIVIFARTT